MVFPRLGRLGRLGQVYPVVEPPPLANLPVTSGDGASEASAEQLQRLRAEVSGGERDQWFFGEGKNVIYYRNMYNINIDIYIYINIYIYTYL